MANYQITLSAGLSFAAGVWHIFPKRLVAFIGPVLRGRSEYASTPRTAPGEAPRLRGKTSYTRGT